MKHLKVLSLVLAMALCLLALAACGGGGAQTTTAAATTAAAATEAAVTTAAATEAETTAAAAAEAETTAAATTTTAVATTTAAATEAEADADAPKVHIKYYGLPQDDDPQSAKDEWEFVSNRLIEKFPNVDWEFTRLAPGSDYRQQYDQLLMSGDGPTFSLMFPYVDIQTRLANGTISEITEYITNWDLKKQGLVNTTFDEAISTPDGKWYAVPGAPYVNGIVYNSAIIEEAGGDPNIIPATWSEFAELASQYTDKEVPRFGYLLLGSEWNAWTYTPWVWAAGGEMVRPNGDGTWAVAFNEGPGVDAALFMNQLIWKDNATQRDVLESYDDMQNHFKAGQACYTWGSPPGFSADDLAKFDQKQEDIGFLPLPAKDDGGQIVSFAGGEVWTISPIATPEQRDVAWEVIQYMSYDED